MILFSLKIKTSRPPQFRKGNMRSVQEIESAFMRMDVNGDGSLTKREMLAADEFTTEEVQHRHIHKVVQILQFDFRLRPSLISAMLMEMVQLI